MVKSRVLQKLRTDDFVKVAGVSRVTDPWLVEVIGRIGYDVVWFDMEHRAYEFDKIETLSLACRKSGIDLMVRIRKQGYDSPMRALEFGANGLMIPHCRSAEEARQWVGWVRFPPAGKRGFDGAGSDANFGFFNIGDYLKHAKEEVFLALQIEDKEAVDHIEEIVAVDGFDLVFIGPADLSFSYGVPLQFDHPVLQKAIARIADAVKKAGKWWGTTTDTAEDAQHALDMGARMVTAGGDHSALVNGLTTSFQQLEQVAIRK